MPGLPTTAKLEPYGLTDDGLVIGKVASSETRWTYSRIDGYRPLEMAAGLPNSKPSVSRDLSRRVMEGFWYTSLTGWRALPSSASGSTTSAVSSNGSWIVAQQQSSYWRFSSPMLRWQVSAEETLVTSTYLHVPEGWRLDSIARVLDDGTVIGTLTTQSSGAYRNMDVFIWHTNGQVESLQAAVRRSFGEASLPGLPRLGKVMSVSADGRRFAGVRELPDSGSLNERAVAWSLYLDEAISPPPSGPDLKLFLDQGSVTFSQWVTAMNIGNQPLTITAATFEGPDASRFSLAVGGQAAPFQPFTLAPGATLSLSYQVQDENIDRSVLLRLASNDPRPDAGVIEIHHRSRMMPSITLGGLPPTIETAAGRLLEVPVSAWCISDYRSVTVEGLALELETEADWSELVPTNPFDLASGGSRRVNLRLRFDEPGVHEAWLRVTGPASCRLPEPLKVTVKVSPQATIEWMAENGVTVLDPATDVLDAGQVTVNTSIHVPVRLRNLGGNPVSLTSRSGFSVDDAFRGPLDSRDNILPPPPVLQTLAAVPAGQTVIKYLRVFPKLVGMQESTVILDSPGQLAAPVTLKVRCTGIAAGPPVFLEQPQSVILSQLGPMPPLKVVGSQYLTAELTTGSSWSQALSIDQQSRVTYTAMPGAWNLRVRNSQGTTTSQPFYIVHLPRGAPSQQSLRVGESAYFSVGGNGPGLTYQWWHEGTKLTDANGYKGSQSSALRVASIKEAHAGRYFCDVTLTGPDRTLTERLEVAHLAVNAPSLAPRVKPFSLRRAREGEFMSFSIQAEGRPGKTTITGLPPGLRQIQAGEGVVQGFISLSAASTKVATYKVRVVVRSGTQVSQVYEVPWEIEPYQDDGLAGTYHGLIEQASSPVRGRFKVTLSTLGSGSFSWEGQHLESSTGKVILIGRGPAGIPADFDPPLAAGMQQPLSAHVLLCIGKIRPDVEPSYLELGLAGDILAGGLTSQMGSAAAAAFRLSKPVPTLVPGSRTAVYTQVLEHEVMNHKVWRELPAQTIQEGGPGLIADAITFLDQRERLHLFGSKSNTVYDHWMWDPEGRKWTDARAALNLPADDPVPPREPEMTCWRSPSGADSWLLTKQGALWRWSGATARWQMIQPPLPVGSVGEAGELGIPAAQNRPRPRQQAATWLLPDGTLWMYGGIFYDALAYKNHYLVDLWRYEPATSQWTWMAGRTLLPGEGPDWRSDGILQPQATADYCPTWVDATSRLWMTAQTSQRRQLMWMFDPSTGAWSLPWSQEANEPVPGKRSKDALCWAGSDGRLYLFGGYDSGVGFPGYNQYPDFHVWYFDLEDNAWTRLELEDTSGFHGGGFGFVRSQIWRTPSGRVHLRGGPMRFATMNTGGGGGPFFLEFGDPRLPEVPGFLASTLTTTGTVSWTGRLPDGEPVMGSSGISRLEVSLPEFALAPGAWVAPCYTKLAHQKSTLLGLLTFQADDGSCGAHLNWSRPQASSSASQRLLPLGFEWLELQGRGWRYDASTWAQNLPAEGLPLDQLAGLPATDLSLSVKAQRFTATLSPWSPSSATVTFLPANGFFSLKGRIGTEPKTSREFQLHGLLLPRVQSAAGQFTVPREVDATIFPRQTATETEILLGGF